MEFYVLKDGISLDDAIKQFIRFLKEYGVYASYKRKFYIHARKKRNEYLRFCTGMEKYNETVKMCEHFYSIRSQFKTTLVDYYVMFVVPNTYKTDVELGYWKFISERWKDYSHKNLTKKIKIF